MYKKITIITLLALVMVIAGCAITPPPHNKENVGAIFNEYPHWYKAAKKTENKWGVPVNVQMAIIYYESSFRADARPPRHYLLGFIPGKHISSAYGYAQALDGTWEDYLVKESGFFRSRTKFESATDFIGWYSVQARNRLGIPQTDAYNLYLAYHEGLTGFERKSFLKKPWLMRYAKSVAIKSDLFQQQLAYYEQGYSTDYLPQREYSPPMISPPELEAPNYYVCNAADPNSEENI